uniref:CASPASE_P20 domain-containing protein n=1 Tax=Macrostomum lignano TaxID=282301 RepID=A0A1I8FP45_9PLAT
PADKLSNLALMGDIRRLQLLANRGNVNRRDRWGRPRCCGLPGAANPGPNPGHKDCASLLLQLGADRQRQRPRRSVGVALVGPSPTTCRCWLTPGPGWTPLTRRTEPLMLASWRGHLAVGQGAAAARLRSRRPRIRTAIRAASLAEMYEHGDVVRLLADCEPEMYRSSTSFMIGSLPSMSRIAKFDHSDYGTFICFLMAHGTKGAILRSRWSVPSDQGSDLTVQAKHLQRLDGKPKLFFIQACRGNVEQVAQPTMESRRLQPAKKATEFETDGESDFLICFANTEDSPAYRHPDEGSVCHSDSVRDVIGGRSVPKPRISEGMVLDVKSHYLREEIPGQRKNVFYHSPPGSNADQPISLVRPTRCLTLPAPLLGRIADRVNHAKRLLAGRRRNSDAGPAVGLETQPLLPPPPLPRCRSATLQQADSAAPTKESSLDKILFETAKESAEAAIEEEKSEQNADNREEEPVESAAPALTSTKQRVRENDAAQIADDEKNEAEEAEGAKCYVVKRRQREQERPASRVKEEDPEREKKKRAGRRRGGRMSRRERARVALKALRSLDDDGAKHHPSHRTPSKSQNTIQVTEHHPSRRTPSKSQNTIQLFVRFSSTSMDRKWPQIQAAQGTSSTAILDPCEDNPELFDRPGNGSHYLKRADDERQDNTADFRQRHSQA